MTYMYKGNGRPKNTLVRIFLEFLFRKTSYSCVSYISHYNRYFELIRPQNLSKFILVSHALKLSN